MNALCSVSLSLVLINIFSLAMVYAEEPQQVEKCYESFIELDSPVFKKKGIRLVPAELKGNGVQVCSLDSSLDTKKKFLLGNDGMLHELTGNVSAKNASLDWGCGGTKFYAAQLTMKRQAKTDGSLVILGDKVENAIRWNPSRRISKPNSMLKNCLNLESGASVKLVDFYVKENSSELIFVATVKPKPGKESTEPTPAEPTIVGLVPKDQKKCVLLDSSDKSPYLFASKFLGTLGAKASSEEWLLFSARGYENFGYVAVLCTSKTSSSCTKVSRIAIGGC